MTQAILSLLQLKVEAVSAAVEACGKIYVYKGAFLWYTNAISVR